MRVYVPATLPLLAELVRTGELVVPTVHAVTPALREAYLSWDAGDDPEELEFAAAGAAEEASLGLLAEGVDAPARRVVLALDAPDVGADGEPADPDDPTAIAWVTPVRWSEVAAVHIDDAEAAPWVKQARALEPADAAIRLQNIALSWYSPEEIPGILG